MERDRYGRERKKREGKRREGQAREEKINLDQHVVVRPGQKAAERPTKTVFFNQIIKFGAHVPTTPWSEPNSVLES